MLTQSILFDDLTCEAIKQLKSVLMTDNTSYIVRVAIASLQKNLSQNSFCGIFPQAQTQIPSLPVPAVNLPGMNERIVKTQMERWQLSADEYMAIVQKTINDFAASGGQMKNPENVIWKACSRYAHERDIQKRAAAAQNTPPADGNGEQPKLRPDGSLPSIYAYQDED